MIELPCVDVKRWLESTDVVLIPIESCEKHGPQIPLGTDSYVTVEAVELLHERLRSSLKPHGTEQVAARSFDSSIIPNGASGVGARGLSPSDDCAQLPQPPCTERDGTPGMNRKPRQRRHSLKIAALTALLLAPAGTIGQTSSTPAFSGRAFVLQATVPLVSPITVADTGPLPAEGGAKEASLLEVAPISVGDVVALNRAEVAHATTVGQGNASRSEASVADLSVTVAGNTIEGDFLMSNATARCSNNGASVSGSSELARLTINGQPVVVSGAANQPIPLPLGAGSIVINEQSSSVNGQSGRMDVNALHVIVNNPTSPGTPLADVIVAHAHADIACPASPPQCGSASTDFVTGGGYIVTPSGSKANFAVAGGIKNGFWGHLMYIDHGSGLRIKGTAVTGYEAFAPNGRRISGLADAGSYEADVVDDGEPGHGKDSFQLSLNGSPVAPATLIDGGNIQLHKPACP